MENNLERFLEELIKHYRDQEVIQYVCYNGTTAPNIVEHDPLFIMESKTSFEHIRQWLVDYLADDKTIHYYALFRALIKEMSGLWVNPTIDELRVFKRRNERDKDAHLKNYVSVEGKWREKTMEHLSEALEKNGYSIHQGQELIESLLNLYDIHNTKNQSFIEWVTPIDLSSIENEADYILDREVFMKPLKLNRPILLEYENQTFPILPSNLSLYFEHVLVTRRGIESRDIVHDKLMDVYFYQEMSDYLQENEYESLETTHQKLTNSHVDPSLPFVEVIVDDYTELYMNTDKLGTEQDLLALINQAYRIEGLDLEAKSLHRKRILKELLTKSFQEDSLLENDVGHSSNKK